MYFFKKVIFVYILTLLVTTNLRATLEFVDLDTTAYPLIKADFFGFSSDGSVQSGSQSDFSIYDNNVSLNIVNFYCASQNPSNFASMVLTIDLSLNTGDNSEQMIYTKTFANELIRIIPQQKVQCAVTCFDVISYLVQEFTSDKAKLSASFLNLPAGAASDCNAGFVFEPTGSLPIVKLGTGDKSVIFVTDGSGSADINKIVQLADSGKVKIFCISVLGPLSQNLKDICIRTGGRWFENIASNESAIKTADVVAALAQNFTPCYLSWVNTEDCSDLHIINLINRRTRDTATFNLFVPDEFKPRIEATPPFLRFSAVLPGFSKSLDLYLYARHGKITIKSFKINNTLFTIEQGDIAQPITLNRNESHYLKIKFTPLDSSLEFASLNIESDGCNGNSVLITGGFPNAQPKKSTLKIVEPHPGKVLLVGDTSNVIWTGLLPTDVVQLEYSTNKGTSWDTLAKNVNGLKYNWTVPDKESDSCKVRVVQLWPNNIGRTLDLIHKNGVNCANFNTDGSLIVTACKDTTARLWNSNNGIRIAILKGHSRAVLWANFDLQDKYIITASEDKTMILWDATTGDSLRTFTGHTNFVRSANFSPDGNTIVSAGADGTCFIWDVKTSKIIDTVLLNGDPLWYSTYSPDGKLIAYSDYSGHCRLWNIADSKVERTLYIGASTVVSHVSFSPDGKKLAASTWLGKAFIWNLSSGETIFTVEHVDSMQVFYPLTSVNFNYTGDLLLTSGTDEAKMWNGNNGAFIPPPFAEHRSSVQSAVFNFDGTRVLTSSWDSTAKIWNLLERALQTGVSESVFSIARPLIEVRSIVFPPTALGDVVDSTITVFITNRTKIPLTINKIKIIGTNASEFSIKDGFAPYTLDTNKSKSIKLHFAPTDVGLRSAQIEIFYAGHTYIDSLSGSCYDPGLQLITKSIDFKKVEIGDFKDSTIQVIFKNRSGNPIKIKKIWNIGPDNLHFSILSGKDTNIINDGETRSMTLRFMPEQIGRRNAVVSVDYYAKGSPLKFTLFGEGVTPKIDSIDLSLKPISGKPGDVVELPIFVRRTGTQYQDQPAPKIMTSLSFNSTLLEPLSVDYPVQITGSERTIRFTIPSVYPTADSAALILKFIVGLGNDTLSNLILSNSIPAISGKIFIAEHKSTFNLTGFCRQGGDRLFESEGFLRLNTIAPNPIKSGSNISFSTIETGIHKVYLTDLLGSESFILFSGFIEPGEHSLFLNTDKVPQGKYMITLESPTRIISDQIEIIR